MDMPTRRVRLRPIKSDDDSDNAPGSGSTVAGVCVICLAPFQADERLTWAAPASKIDSTESDEIPEGETTTPNRASNDNDPTVAESQTEMGENNLTCSSNSRCQHAFHKDCIIPWLCRKDEHNQCPICRQEFCPQTQVQPPWSMLGQQVGDVTAPFGSLTRAQGMGLEEGLLVDMIPTMPSSESGEVDDEQLDVEMGNVQTENEEPRANINNADI